MEKTGGILGEYGSESLDKFEIKVVLEKYISSCAGLGKTGKSMGIFPRKKTYLT